MLRVGDHEQRPEYVLAPKGYHPAICTEIKDLGLVESSFKGEKKIQHKVRFTWVLEGTTRSDGGELAISQRYTLSAYENAKLRKHVCGWTGKSMTEEEFKRFDLETLLKTRCQLFIEHNTTDGKTFANVVSIGEAPVMNYASLAKKIEGCWTHNGLDTIKQEAISAKRQGFITTEEITALAQLSQARRVEINNPKQEEGLPSF